MKKARMIGFAACVFIWVLFACMFTEANIRGDIAASGQHLTKVLISFVGMGVFSDK